MSFLPESSLDGGVAIAERLGVMENAPTLAPDAARLAIPTLSSAPKGRLSVSAMLAASASMDRAAIAALKRGETWTKIIVDGSDVLAMEEAFSSMRIYVERSFEAGFKINARLEKQNGDWEWDLVNIDNGDEDLHLNSEHEVTDLYPFWGELAKRHIREIQADHNLLNAGGAVKNYKGQSTDGLVCNECAYAAGARFDWAADQTIRQMAGKCPVCERSPRWLAEPSMWVDFPADLLNTRHAGRNEPAVLPQIGSPDPDVAAILALPKMSAHTVLLINQWDAYDVEVYKPTGPDDDLHSVLLLAFRDVTGAWELSVLEHYTGERPFPNRPGPAIVGFDHHAKPVYHLARTPEDVARIMTALKAQYTVESHGLRDCYEEWLEQQNEAEESPDLRLAA